MTCRKLLLEYNARAASRRARGTVPRCATKKEQTFFGTLAPHGERAGVAFPLRGGAPVSEPAGRREDASTIYFELEDVPDPATLIFDLNALSIVRAVERAPSFQKVYGKRIIVIGGGAQVGQVVVGAVAEADRHNIRGERISVDTIPLVGEEDLAGA